LRRIREDELERKDNTVVKEIQKRRRVLLVTNCLSFKFRLS